MGKDCHACSPDCSLKVWLHFLKLGFSHYQCVNFLEYLLIVTLLLPRYQHKKERDLFDLSILFNERMDAKQLSEWRFHNIECCINILVLVLNSNMHIDIKPYFCLLYRSILKYRGMRCLPLGDLPNSFTRFSISRNVNKYGVSALA